MLLFFAVGFVGRAWMHRRRFGTSGVMLFRSGVPGQRWRDSFAISLFLLSLAQAVAAAAWPAGWWKFSVLPQPAGTLWQICGGAILLGGIACLALAQHHLGSSWRIGIEEEARPGLISGGLFRFCRNPIFLAVLIVLAGYTLLLTTWFSLALWLATAVLVKRQVSEEEAYLRRAYPEEFPAYARRVGRFLPGIGRLHRGH